MVDNIDVRYAHGHQPTPHIQSILIGTVLETELGDQNTKVESVPSENKIRVLCVVKTMSIVLISTISTQPTKNLIWQAPPIVGRH